MNMPSSVTLKLAAAALAGAAIGFPGLAAAGACLLEGNVVLGDKSLPVRDCLENHGVPESNFRGLCEQIQKIGQATGVSKLTYLDACPSGSRGSCSVFFSAPVAGYYYLRTDKDLERTKAACIKQGGVWK